MGHRGRLTLLCFLMLAGCKHKTVVQNDAGKPDRLGPAEYPEDKQPLFALAMPRGSQITYRWRNELVAETPLVPEQLSNFVQARIKGGTVVRGTTSTKWDQTTANKEPGRVLQIEVRPLRGKFLSELHVTDITPVPIDPKQTEADRWKAVGLTPDGKVIDRKNMQ